MSREAVGVRAGRARATPATAGTVVDGGLEPVATPHPLSPRFLAFVSATGLSSLGDAAWLIALTATLTRVAGPATTGAVMALAGLPRVVAMLGGGAMADRRGPARVMISTDLARCLLMLAAALVIVLFGPSIPLLLVLAAVLAFLGSFFVPASGALRPQLLPSEHLVRGNALYLIGLRSGQAAGGPVGAWLLGVGGIATVAVVNGVSFLASAGAVLRCVPRAVRRAPRKAIASSGTATKSSTGAQPPQPPLSKRIAEGLRYVAHDRDLGMLMVVTGLVELASSGPVNVGLILLSHSIGAGNTGAGLLLTAFTVGATVSFLISLVLPVGRHAAMVAVVGALAQAAVLISLGLGGSLWPALVGYALLGAVGAQISLVLTSLIQTRTPLEVRGRVMSIMSLIIFGVVPLGNLTIGAMIEWLGLTVTMTIQGVLAFLAALAFLSKAGLRSAALR